MADVERERVTALWREAAAAVETPRCTCTEDESSNGSATYEDDPHCPIHGWCSWRAECGRLREQLDAALQALDPATVAESFHAHYERLAPDYGYRTREESAVPWVSVPLLKKRLMVATVTEALAAARAALGVEGEADDE